VEPTCLNVHPVYGAIYKNGEFVQRGAVIGLSVDSREVIIAPISGWIKIIEAAQSPCPPDQGLRVEIWEGDARAAVPH
jgi:hypothetical protein